MDILGLNTGLHNNIKPHGADGLTRISYNAFVAWLTAAAYPDMSSVRSLGLLDALSSTSPGLSVARAKRSDVFTPVYTASLRNPLRNEAKTRESVIHLSYVQALGRRPDIVRKLSVWIHGTGEA